MLAYRYGELGFEAPRDWSDVSVLTFAEPGPTALPSATLTRESAMGAKTAESFAKKQLPILKRAMKKHRLVAKGAVEIDGGPAYRYEHRFVSDARISVHQLQYFFKAGEDIAVLSLTCTVEALDAQRALLESIANSVRRESNS